MSDTRRAAQCEGKAAFATFDLAKRVNARRRLKGRRANTYHCPHCRQWHLGRKQRHRRDQ